MNKHSIVKLHYGKTACNENVAKMTDLHVSENDVTEKLQLKIISKHIFLHLKYPMYEYLKIKTYLILQWI